MNKQTLMEKIKEMIGGIAFKIFLWSIDLSMEDYHYQIMQEYEDDY